MSVRGSGAPPTAASSIASHASARAAAELADWPPQRYVSEGRGTAATSSVASVADAEAAPSLMQIAEAACEGAEEHDILEGLSEEERLLQQQQLMLFQQQQLEEQQQQQFGVAEASQGGGAAAALPGGGALAATAGAVLSTPPPMLPFSPPESVKTWLRREDWEALSRAWAEAEAQACFWAEGEGDELEDEALWDEDEETEASRSGSQSSSNIVTTSITSSAPSRRRSRRRPKWDQEFTHIGIDSRRPPPLRRYFDTLPAETSPPVQAVRRELRPKPKSLFREEDDESPTAGKDRWVECWGSVASSENDKLHPFLRHYFDHRGLEASYRQRPHIDSKWLREMKPRTPGRPSTREKIEKWRSASEPVLGAASPSKAKKEKVVLDAGTRGAGSIHWGTRCLVYGPDGEVRTGPNGEQIPWVYDHHISETEDNELMNPLLRHYFDQDGMESSFRNRGRHYGRAKKACFGLAPIPQALPSAAAQAAAAQASPPQPRSASLRSSPQNSSVPSKAVSRQASLQSGQPFSRQTSGPAPSYLPSAPHSRATSVPVSRQPSRRPSMQPSLPHSRHPSLQPLGMGAWPLHASPPASLPSRQSSLLVSRQGRVSIGSPIGSVAGSIVGSVEAGESSRRAAAPPAPALPAC